jgi:hypothetical protein
MSDIENEDVIEVPDELTALKARADLLGISYHPSIGVEKLRDKVSAALAEPEEETAKPVVNGVETENERRARKKNEANTLIRVRVACMNPNKKEWEGEVITAGNSVVGTFKKYVPFNADEGWHVPQIIYNQLIQRECQVFVTTRDARGNTSRKGKLIKEFAVEVLPQLTQKELDELARRQAMAKSID